MLQKLKTLAFGSIRHTIVTVTTALFLAAILVCLICDVFTGGGLTWSLAVMGSLAYLLPIVWLLVLKRRHKLEWTIAAAGVLAVPLLLWIGRALGEQGTHPLLLPLLIGYSAVCIALALALYFLRKNRAGRTKAHLVKQAQAAPTPQKAVEGPVSDD